MGLHTKSGEIAMAALAGEPRYVTFSGVGKSYDARTLSVRDVNLAVRRGEFFTLLGPSGSGKTSCLMMLAGFERPTVGEIRLAGRSLGSVAPYDRNIGVVFQSYALFPHMTVAENVAYPLSVRKKSRAEIEERTKWILGMVRLDEFAARHPSQLSGGQQQRVALARALVFNPDLVLMDEPLGALDRQLREHLQIEIRRIQQEIGATVIFVTHDQSEALSMSDRIAVFNKGEVQQADTPQSIYRPAGKLLRCGFRRRQHSP
jgi:putative spermidine/putrescine transport system ATP-binding protein